MKDVVWCSGAKGAFCLSPLEAQFCCPQISAESPSDLGADLCWGASFWATDWQISLSALCGVGFYMQAQENVI